MTVKELIEKLQQFPPDSEVMMETEYDGNINKSEIMEVKKHNYISDWILITDQIPYTL